ncbi:rho-GTPase-activating protein-like protein [Mollisia scopiformis]|uniref:Rho-GTPase-activating protein-like protein n=1 Tax=Mollisia scopiformis TaxID=149040 RepID=A0A132B5P5_MOLSC|nr:rho-GTPase-activating protein-like protein [Mollisia scopiformis]KUJ07730.1 rho-GTPase-activating protein-like protein [Mollisia scopiformis]
MPGFADSFWSTDYAGGLGVLFGKLQQGVQENQQMLTIARMRAEAEDSYGMKLGEIGSATDRMSGGFSRDDGASVKKAYDGVRTEMEEAAKNHRKIAQSIRDLVVAPFTRWCDAHESRVQNSQDDLQARIKLHDKQAETVRKLRSHYFTKCRLVEDIEEENKLAFQDPETSPKPKVPEIKISDNREEEEEPFEIGDEVYQPEQVKKILSHLLNTIRLGETKVPILGTYQNTTSGAEIVEYFQKFMGATSVSHAERIGQDLIGNGLLRLIGNVGNIFANSSKMFYQWKPKAFQLSGVPEKKVPMNRTFSIASNSDSIDSPVVGTVTEYLAGWNPLNTQHPNETPGDRLRREAAEADERYKASVRKLDLLRCQLEEAIIEHLRYLQRCELDRLKAIKTIILDFSGTISNVIPSLQSTVDNMMLFQETVQPDGDLRYLLENYRTGGFAPKVVVYENYYNSADEQTFGVDLEARARADRKRVPAIITSILTFLDHRYPDLEGDEARRSVWLVEVPLHQTHRIRAALNTGKGFGIEALEPYEIPIIASVLKLYLLELPDSLVSSHVYEIMKTIYSTPASESTDSARISVLQNTLSQLRLSNIATLDALMTHFTRLIELTSADETYISALATSLASCILRPRTETSMTMEEKYSYRLIRDLFAHKDAIFSELKRASSLSHSISVDTRPRAISTDESNRKANMEARARAIISAGSRSRATSPAPSPRGHRRDRSSGGPETRFPIQTSPTHTTDTARTPRPTPGMRQSLEVPNESAPVVAAEPTNGTPLQSITNGVADAPAASATYMPGGSDGLDDIGVEKRNSLGRSAPAPSARYGRRPVGAGMNRMSTDHSSRNSVASLGGNESSDSPVGGRVGVSLTDKPMDD